MHKRILETMYIQLDTSKCKACWSCIEECTNKTIGKVDIFFHKHARFLAIEKCTGCRKCVKACKFGALMPLTPEN
ncbi:MAG: 4Fe-4S binding protein [Bacteroidota bacterium]|nr:4Fe-4S binding protein [Bacteroidota bacterium]MDP4192850.1 4Fe-4S binding protein [Bacteroidota bacterium]MDP4197674.1 4Fe-4S binding protein [Bacteroidota bacterium]